jgi:uncharacterized membrane protein YheB (UPF0754 family)
MLDGIDIDKTKQDIKSMLVKKISEAVPPMAKMFLGDNVESMIGGFIDKEGDKIFEDLIDKLKEKATSGLDIKALVKKRIDELDFVEFEKIVFGLMSRELRHIEIIGLFLGMIIGLIQYFVTLIQF